MKKRLTNISYLGHGIYLLNHKFRVQIDEPIDRELVRRYFPIYFLVRSKDYTVRFTSRSLVLQGSGVRFIIVKKDDDYILTITESKIDGLGKFVTYTTEEVLDFNETARRVNAY